MLKQNYILFRKTPQCFWPSIAAIIFCILYSVYKFIEDSLLREFNYIDIVEHTDMMLGNSIYYYILFLYLSFEYTSIVKKTNMVESISTYTMSSIKRESQQLLILYHKCLIMYVHVSSMYMPLYTVRFFLCRLLYIYN